MTHDLGIVAVCMDGIAHGKHPLGSLLAQSWYYMDFPGSWGLPFPLHWRSAVFFRNCFAMFDASTFRYNAADQERSCFPHQRAAHLQGLNARLLNPGGFEQDLY